LTAISTWGGAVDGHHVVHEAHRQLHLVRVKRQPGGMADLGPNESLVRPQHLLHPPVQRVDRDLGGIAAGHRVKYLVTGYGRHIATCIPLVHHIADAIGERTGPQVRHADPAIGTAGHQLRIAGPQAGVQDGGTVAPVHGDPGVLRRAPLVEQLHDLH